MKEINVTGQKRTDLGKKASKALRKELCVQNLGEARHQGLRLRCRG
jgi:large subunit ribosomal protein L25